MDTDRALDSIENAWSQYKQQLYIDSIAKCKQIVEELKLGTIKGLSFFQNIAYVFIALIYSIDGKINDAIEELTLATIKDSNIQDSLSIRAALYHHQGKMRNSFDDCTRVLTINPKNILALIIKGDALKYDIPYMSDIPLKTVRNEELIYYQQALELDKENTCNFIGRGFQGSDELVTLRNGEKRGSTQWWHHLNKMFELYSIEVPKYWNIREKTKEDESNALVFFTKLFKEEKEPIIVIQKPVPTEIKVKENVAPVENDKKGNVTKRKKKAPLKIKMFQNDVNINAPVRNYSKPWLEDSYKTLKVVDPEKMFLKRGKGTARKSEGVRGTVTAPKSPSTFAWQKPVSTKESILPSFRTQSPTATVSPKASRTPPAKKAIKEVSPSKFNSSLGDITLSKRAKSPATSTRPSTAPTNEGRRKKTEPTKKIKEKPR